MPHNQKVLCSCPSLAGGLSVWSLHALLRQCVLRLPAQKSCRMLTSCPWCIPPLTQCQLGLDQASTTTLKGEATQSSAGGMGTLHTCAFLFYQSYTTCTDKASGGAFQSYPIMTVAVKTYILRGSSDHRVSSILESKYNGCYKVFVESQFLKSSIHTFQMSPCRNTVSNQSNTPPVVKAAGSWFLNITVEPAVLCYRAQIANCTGHLLIHHHHYLQSVLQQYAEKEVPSFTCWVPAITTIYTPGRICTDSHPRGLDITETVQLHVASLKIVFQITGSS